MNVSAITFDVGGTLIEPWPSVGHVYSEIAARHGVKHVPPELLDSRFKVAWRAQRNFAHARAAWAELVDETFRGLCAEIPSETFFAALYDHFALPEAWRIFDDVLPTLESLAASGVRLGTISNWDERLRILLRRLQLEKYFEASAISCEVGLAKPSPVIFQRAAEAFGLPASSILHVGDSRELDFQGAESAGFQALLLQRNANPSGACVIASLAELPAKLAGHKRP